MSISDRVVVMEQGRATQVDRPQRLYEHPRTRFISTFVGKANLLEGRVNGEGAVDVGPLRVVVDDTGFRPGAAVLLSVRPEKLQFVVAGLGRIDGEVAERFFLGSQWLYRVDTAIGALAVLCPNDGRTALETGQRTGIDWPVHCSRLLPVDSASPAVETVP
jgi:putative spermidine/putrescine transport system ATP-binding protein